MYRSCRAMLSFLGAGLGWLLAAVSIRSVSGALSHRMGLDAVLLEPDLSGRVAIERFSNVHCWSCEATAVSAIFLVESKANVVQWAWACW
jgi:hypothetical protein